MLSCCCGLSRSNCRYGALYLALENWRPTIAISYESTDVGISRFLLFFAPMLVNLGQVFEMTNLGCERLQVKLLKTLDYAG